MLEVELPPLAVMGISEKSDLHKGKKRYAQRQHDLA
jgi:hypothetical protein